MYLFKYKDNNNSPFLKKIMESLDNRFTSQVDFNC